MILIADLEQQVVDAFPLCAHQPMMLSSLTELNSPMALDSDEKKAGHLWQNRSHNFLTEKSFNAAVATIEPYCAICSLFCPYIQVGPKHLNVHGGRVLRCGSHTRPLVPEMCFSAGAENTEPLPSNSHIRDDGTSVLLSCSSCCMQVHASEYKPLLLRREMK